MSYKALESFFQRFIIRENHLNEEDINTYLLRVIPTQYVLSENKIKNIINDEINKTLQRVNNNKNLTQKVLKNEKNIDNLNDIYNNSYNEKRN